MKSGVRDLLATAPLETCIAFANTEISRVHDMSSLTMQDCTPESGVRMIDT